MSPEGSPGLDEASLKFKVVEDILDGRMDEALEQLSRRYRVPKPKVKVGRVKGTGKSWGCYDPRRRIIYAASSDQLRNPRVILHEFYHHLRCSLGSDKGGVEKYADKFADDYIRSYLEVRRGLPAYPGKK
jgi:hypothetical protein